MATEFGQHGIQVNAVVPGATMTSERLEALGSGRSSGLTYVMVPEGTKTREKMQQMIEGGELGLLLKTQMPMGRPGFSDNLAKVVLFMASDLASYVNSTSLFIDGAQTVI